MLHFVVLPSLSISIQLIRFNSRKGRNFTFLFNPQYVWFLVERISQFISQMKRRIGKLHLQMFGALFGS